MSFLYPNLISLSRPNPADVVGAQDYSGVTQAGETVLASGIPAHIQTDRQGTLPVARIAADAAGQSIWKVIFKGASGMAQTGDVITDELGSRYQVIAADWGPLVTTCHCQILQA